MDYPIIDPAKLAEAQDAAYGYIYSEVTPAEALHCGLSDRTLVKLGEGMTLRLPLDYDPDEVDMDDDLPEVEVGEGTLVELVLFVDFYRIYSAVTPEGKAYDLSST